MILKVIDTLKTEQELKVVETAREHQVEIEGEIEVEEQKDADLKREKQQKGAANSYTSLRKQVDCRKGLRRTKTRDGG